MFDRRIGAIIIGLTATLLFFLSIGLADWSCQDSILGHRCINLLVGKVTGSLLLVAGFLIVLNTVFLVVAKIWDDVRFQAMSIIICAVATILSLAGMIYYLRDQPTISPYIAVAAMSVSFTLTLILLFDHIESLM